MLKKEVEKIIKKFKAIKDLKLRDEMKQQIYREIYEQKAGMNVYNQMCTLTER